MSRELMTDEDKGQLVDWGVVLLMGIFLLTATAVAFGLAVRLFLASSGVGC